MLTIACVLKSGGIYDASWVDKLKRGVERNLTVPHRFKCLSDVEVDCERIELKHDWPGWWSKIELFNGAVTGPSLYLDLDTVITGNIDEFANNESSFAMLENFNDKEFVGSGVMWFKDKAPVGVYERFVKNPRQIMDYYAAVKNGSYMGDQAFLFDVLDRKIDKISHPSLVSYKKHCRGGLPAGAAIVCFHGRPRPTEINPKWLSENWI